MGIATWRLMRKGDRRAYEDCRAELTLVRDERDRILRSLEKQRLGRSLPPGLGGRQLCFMHIGKTAGTSIQHALFEAMRDAAIFHESLENFDTASMAQLAINDLVVGHLMFQHVSNAARSLAPAASPEEFELIRGLNAVDLALYVDARGKLERNRFSLGVGDRD
jgi:hypothetical protein